MSIHPSYLSKVTECGTAESSDSKSFRGPAPLHHTLLAGRQRTGISLQTLHPERFDHGIVLAQTPSPGFAIPEPTSCTVRQLLELVAPKGADMLIQGIRDRLYVPPLVDNGWFGKGQNALELMHAPKIKSEDRHIDWTTWTAEEILRRHRVMGPLWNTASGGNLPALRKRIIWESGFEVAEVILDHNLPPGVPFADDQCKQPGLFVGTCDGKILRIKDVKVEGEKTTPPLHAVGRAGMMDDFDGVQPGKFREPLG